MKRFHALVISFSLCAAANCFAQTEFRETAAALETQGKFKETVAVLTNALANKSLATAKRKELEFELDRLDRIRKDYKLTKEALFKALKESVKDVTESEFEGWIAEGRFDSREIDGERRFSIGSDAFHGRNNHHVFVNP